MARGGPRPHPTALKLLHGERRPSRVNYNAPVAPEGRPELAPDVNDPAVLEVWSQLVEHCDALGVLSRVDGIALLTFAQAVVINRRAAQLINQTDVLITDREHGKQLRMNPAIRVWRSSFDAVLRLCQEFGLTPSARTILVNPRPSKADDRERLLS